VTRLDVILAELRACGQRLDARAAEYEAARQETRATIDAGAEALDRAFVAAIAGGAA
jgi:hypothetical protein